MSKDQIIAELREEVSKLNSENTALRTQLSILQKQFDLLLDEFTKFKIRKNSRNSSIPPSQDVYRPSKNKSLRKKTGKKPGGQPGHKGNTLEFNPTPTKIIEHKPVQCAGCGVVFHDKDFDQVERRQIIDIPEVSPTCVEHRAYEVRCNCGRVTRSKFPSGVKSNVSYGRVVMGMVAYLHGRQYIPYKRTAELLSEFFGLSISTGGIRNLLSRMSEKSIGCYDHIKSEIQRAHYVGADESSNKVNGKKHWMWTWQNHTLSYIVASTNRAYSTIEKEFPEGFLYAVLVSDRYAAQLKTVAKDYQICLAHLLRDVEYLNELSHHKWSGKFQMWLLEIFSLKRNQDLISKAKMATEITRVENQLDDMLTEEIPVKHTKLNKFREAMIKLQDYLVTCLYYPEVPADNNGSERVVRTFKVKNKISGCFRSTAGADQYAVLRSIIDTTLKNDQNPFGMLQLIAAS